MPVRICLSERRDVLKDGENGSNFKSQRRNAAAGEPPSASRETEKVPAYSRVFKRGFHVTGDS